MKKFSFFKVIQVSLLAIMALVCTYLLMRPEVKQDVFSDKTETVLFMMIWVILVASFLFVFIDLSLLSSIKLSYHNLYGAAYADQLSGIPNRFSCDTIIEKYADTKLPEEIAAVMIDLANLPEVNQLYGHAAGNKLLKDFSAILSASAVSFCFVGRNGGNKFLAIFEDGDDKKVYDFLARVENRVKHHNQAPDSIRMEYRAGTALNNKEHLQQITELISLANERIYKHG